MISTDMVMMIENLKVTTKVFHIQTKRRVSLERTLGLLFFHLTMQS